MYKIFMTVRNRLAVTKKSIESLYKHSTIPFHLYVYDNSSNYLLKEHFDYFYKLYEDKKIAQITFTTEDSTFNAFSKASTCNFFGRQHEEDPNKDKYGFLLLMDNDIIVTPNFDQVLRKAWKQVRKTNMKNIKVITQFPAGIKHHVHVDTEIAGFKHVVGKLGGSAFWSVNTDFFRTVGFLELVRLVNVHKRHDITYWNKMDRVTGGKPYILGLKTKLCYHAGRESGSVCNVLTKQPKDKSIELIKFEKSERIIDELSFDEFYNYLKNNEKVDRW